MMQDPSMLIGVLAGSSAVLAWLASLALGRLATRVGAVCQPRADRWSAKPVPLFGGPAIVLAVSAVLLFAPQLPSTIWVLLAGATALAAVGLWDDLRPITPYTKLSAQLAAAAAVTAAGLRFPLTGIPVVDIVITVAWIVGLSNAFNLLDNMDGLAAGVAAIAGSVRLWLFLAEGDMTGAYVSAVLVGACLGFLTLNFNPARIFMGDSGSMFLGFFVAGLSTIGGSPDSRATASVLIGPVALMMVPIFDTTLVTVLRVLAGRPISQGGRDHTSHRLVAAGLSERRAVLTLYALAATAGAVGVITRNLGRGTGLTLFALLAVAMLLLGVTLARVRVYQTERTVPRTGFRFRAAPGLSFVRQFTTAGIDGLLAMGALSLAFTFGRGLDPSGSALVIDALPLVFAVKMVALAIFRANNRVWRYTNSHDLLAIAQASTVGSALAVLVIAALADLTAAFRVVFVLDWIFLTALLGASRLALRGMAEFLRPAPEDAARVLVYGAGDAGVALLQELRNNPAMCRVVVGFLDDDPMMHRARVQGLPILGAGDRLPGILASHAVDEVIVASGRLSPERLESLRTACAQAGVRLSRFRIAIDNLAALAQVRQIR